MADSMTLSPSKLEMFQRCGVQYSYRYIDGLKVPPSLPMLEGRATDRSASFMLSKKALEGSLPVDAEVASVAADAMRAEWSGTGEVMLDADEARRGGKGALGYAVDRSVRMARKYRTGIAPLIRPMLDPTTKLPRIQHKWELDTGRGLILNGVSDNEEADAVNDLKAKAKPAPARASVESVQLTAYALAKHVIDGVETPRVRLHVVVDRPKLLEGTVAGDSPAGLEVQILESIRTKEQMQSYVDRAEVAMTAIKAGIFLPARPTDWWCSNKFCGYHDRCPFAVRPVSVAMSEQGDISEGRSDEG